MLRKEQEIPSGHDPALYETERIHATSHDGRPIPVSLLYRKGMARDGNAPVLLYAYGSYGLAVPAAFVLIRHPARLRSEPQAWHVRRPRVTMRMMVARQRAAWRWQDLRSVLRRSCP